MWAICSSASKSEIARRPRTTWRAPTLRQASTVSPSKIMTSTRSSSSGSSSAIASRIADARTSASPAGAFRGFTRTATTTRSKTPAARCRTSTCPSVIGSNDPG